MQHAEEFKEEVKKEATPEKRKKAKRNAG